MLVPERGEPTIKIGRAIAGAGEDTIEEYSLDLLRVVLALARPEPPRDQAVNSELT